MAETPYKTCSRCKLVKDYTKFLSDERSSDSKQSACKACVNDARRARRNENLEAARAKARDYVSKNKDRVYANNNASRQRNQESVRSCKKRHYERVKNMPEFLAKRVAYANSTKDAKRQYDREYRKRDPQKCLDRANAWRKANPEKRAAVIRNYSAKRRGQTKEGVTTRDLHAWIIKQRKVCYWCAKKCAKNFHVDHYMPLSRGGQHALPNLVIACAGCNLRKNAKHPLDFAKQVGRLF